MKNLLPNGTYIDTNDNSVYSGESPEDTKEVKLEIAGKASKTEVEEKANKSKLTSGIVSAANWTGSAVPYSQTLILNGAAPDPVVIEIKPIADATADQRAAWRNAIISGVSQTTDSITIIADGVKPSIDIPIIGIIRGDM